MNKYLLFTTSNPPGAHTLKLSTLITSKWSTDWCRKFTKKRTVARTPRRVLRHIAGTSARLPLPAVSCRAGRGGPGPSSAGADGPGPEQGRELLLDHSHILGPAGRPRAGPAGRATPSALADAAARRGAAQDMAMMHFSPHLTPWWYRSGQRWRGWNWRRHCWRLRSLILVGWREGGAVGWLRGVSVFEHVFDEHAIFMKNGRWTIEKGKHYAYCEPLS